MKLLILAACVIAVIAIGCSDDGIYTPPPTDEPEQATDDKPVDAGTADATKGSP